MGPCPVCNPELVTRNNSITLCQRHQFESDHPPLVLSCKASGREVYLQTYAEPPPVRLVFHTAADAAQFAKLVGAARKGI